MSDTGKPLTAAQVTQEVLATLAPPGSRYWWLVAGVSGVLAVGVAAWVYQIYTGIGVANLDDSVMWGVYITNFVFWVGIAHSGTLISAILYLFRARWRTSIYRTAEAMTVFAIITAGLFPIIHLGRPWFFYWLIPYPNERQLWVNFRSPLVWDFFAILTYLLVSVTFFWVGLIPDVAAARDRAHGWRRLFYGALAVGWRGSGQQWRHYRSAYVFFAALATPLVISVHSVVSWDFAMAITPGWHSTIFAPYFVSGAIFSGVSLVVTLLIPLRRLLRLERYITVDHFENLAKIMLMTSLIVTYAYITEFFVAWIGENPNDLIVMVARVWGPWAPVFTIMLLCNSCLPLLLFIPRVRRTLGVLFTIAVAANIGMWLERFIIVVSSLGRKYLPYTWDTYSPSPVEIAITVGSFAWFFLWLLLFVRHLPPMAIAEMKEQILEQHAAGVETS